MRCYSECPKIVLVRQSPSCFFHQIKNGDFKEEETDWTIVVQEGSGGDFFWYPPGATDMGRGLDPKLSVNYPSNAPFPYPFLTQTGPGSYVLYQRTTIPLEGKTTLHFDFVANDLSGQAPLVQDTMSSENGSNQHARVSIMPDNFLDSEWFGSTSISAEKIGHVFTQQDGMTFFLEDEAPVFTPFSLDVSSCAGQAVIIAFRSVDNLTFFNFAINNVRLENTVCTPVEPAVEPQSAKKRSLHITYGPRLPESSKYKR